MNLSKVELPSASYFLDEYGILHCQYTKDSFDCELTAAEVLLHVDAIKELCDKVPRPFLLDRRDTVGLLSMEAGKLLAGHEEIVKLRISESYVVNTLATRLLVRFYMRMYTTSCPSELFTSIDHAIEHCKANMDIFNNNKRVSA